jgi:hypothetical protein
MEQKLTVHNTQNVYVNSRWTNNSDVTNTITTPNTHTHTHTAILLAIICLEVETDNATELWKTWMYQKLLHPLTTKRKSFKVRSQNCEKRLLGSPCQSLRTHATTRFPLDGFWWNFILEFFFESPENSRFIKIQQKYRETYMKTFSHLWQYLKRILPRMENVLGKICKKKTRTYILQTTTFLPPTFMPFMR